MIIPMTDDERRLTEEYLYLVPEMVKKLTTRCAYVSYDEQQDLLQAGNLALCKAAMNYDNTRPFAVYARVAIRNAIYSYWRKLQKERKYTCSMYASSEFDMEPLLVDQKTELWQEQCMNQEPIYKHLQSLEARSCNTLRKGIHALLLQQKGYTNQEISKHYGVPMNHVRAWQSKARKYLQQEFFLWSSLAFQIRQIHELQSAFSERLKKHHRSENIPIEPYLNRLLLRGLVVKGDGLTGVDALYRLLGELYISPLQDSFSVRLFTCIYLCMKKKLHTKELIHYLKKPARTAIEDTVLQIAKKVQISTAELVTCVEQGIHPQNTEQLLTQLYETSDATFRTLAQDIQFTHAGYPVLEAISNLYLNKQIAFEKL